MLSINEYNIKLAKNLCEILSCKRSSDYNCWKQVGYTLKAIDESLFDNFVKFSKKEEPTACEQIWSAGENYKEFYSIETLKHWAKVDNSTEYYKIILKMNYDKFDKAETHIDISQIIYEIYKNYLVCINISKNKWYKFENHRWNYFDSTSIAQELISDDFLKMIRTFYPQKLNECQDNSEQYIECVNKLTKMMSILNSNHFRNKVVKECAILFYRNDFETKLDSNTELIGFYNGIFDFKEMCFRDGLPSDYVTKTVGYSWKSFTEDDPVFADINKFLSKIQPENDMREYLLTFISKILRGKPDEINVWCGNDNNTSIIIELIKQLLGDYFGTLPITVITRKRMSVGSPNIPELADKQGKRFLAIQESENDNDAVYISKMREYINADMIVGKPLYGNPYSFKPQYTMVFTCYNLPHIPYHDYKTWKMLKVGLFDSNISDINIKSISKNFPNWIRPLMWLIITKYYPIFEKGVDAIKYKIYEPDKITQFTKRYNYDSDIYAEFLNEMCITTYDDNNTESLMELYQAFKHWYLEVYTEYPPARKQLADYLIENNYVLNEGKVHGIKFHPYEL